jgi:hypothetical protein
MLGFFEKKKTSMLFVFNGERGDNRFWLLAIGCGRLDENLHTTSPKMLRPRQYDPI